MSRYHEFESQFKDEQCLVEALNEQGYKTVEVHKEPVSLIGYHGDTRTAHLR